MSGIHGGHLKQFIERIERLEDEKKDLAQDVREIYAEAKSQGFDPKIMRQVIRVRRLDKDERDEQEELLTLYLSAVESGLAAKKETQEG